jgi:tetratricopeptide (TPR) repeat protein
MTMRSTTIRALAAAFFIGAAAVSAAGIVGTTGAEAATIRNPQVAKLMKEAQSAGRAGNWREALSKAQQAENIAGGSERTTATQLVAWAATNAGAYGVALNAYDKLIAAGAVNRTEGLRTAMRLAMRANMSARALQYANQLGGADPLLQAQLNYQAGNCREVIRILQGALSSAKPNEDALKYLGQCYYRQGNKEGGMRVLELRAIHYPTAETWSQVLRLAQKERGLPDRGLLEVYRLRLAVGDLKAREDFVEMAQVAIQFKTAAEAKAVLDKGLAAKVLIERDQRLIAVAAQTIARTPAEIARLRQMAAARDPNAEVQLAEILWSQGQFPQAEQAVRRGMAGTLKDPDGAKFVLGHILLSQGKRAEAAAAFSSVSKTGKLASIARLWALHARR